MRVTLHSDDIIANAAAIKSSNLAYPEIVTYAQPPPPSDAARFSTAPYCFDKAQGRPSPKTTRCI